MYKLVFTIGILALVLQQTYAQCSFTSTSAGGAWTASGTWSGGTAPSSSSPSGNVCISNNATVTLSAPTFSGSVTITIGSGSTLSITGDLHIGSNMVIVVQSGGTLNVSGSFYTDNNGGTPTLTNDGTVNITQNVSEDGAGVITNGSTTDHTATFSVGGNYTITNSGNTNHKTDNYAVFNVTGSMSLSNPFTVYTSGFVTVTGNVTTLSSPSLTVGQNASGPPYADMIVKGNLNMNGGGTSVTVNKNGRLAVFQKLTHSNNGGIDLNLSSGAQVYVNDASGFTNSGGDQINNSTSLFYTTTSAPTNAVSPTSQNAATTMASADPTFATWLQLNGVGPSVLPITLISFSAEIATGDTGIMISWATASELNFDYFSLQRSDDGKVFNEIAQIKGHGTTAKQHSYDFNDNQPIAGRSYYRLISNDFDGYQQVFNVVSVTYQAEKTFNVSPNPSDGISINLNFNFANETDGNVTIFDNAGSIVGTYPVTSTGSIVFGHALTTGVYMAKYTSVKLTKTERFLVK